MLFYPARLYWYLARPVVFGAGAILEYDGKILLVRHTYGDRSIWRVPGGGIKKGEEAFEAAVREIKEELGLFLHLVKIGIVNTNEDHKRVNSTCFYAKLDNPTIHPNKNEIEEARWWNIQDLPQLSPVAKENIKLLRAR